VRISFSKTKEKWEGRGRWEWGGPGEEKKGSNMSTPPQATPPGPALLTLCAKKIRDRRTKPIKNPEKRGMDNLGWIGSTLSQCFQKGKSSRFTSSEKSRVRRGQSREGGPKPKNSATGRLSGEKDKDLQRKEGQLTGVLNSYPS